MNTRRLSHFGFLAACVIAMLMVLSVDAKGEQPTNVGIGKAEVMMQAVSPSPEPETYGTASQTVMVIGSYMFNGIDSATTFQQWNGINRYISNGGGCCALAHPVLPNGALVEKIELQACDTTDTDWVTAGLYTCATLGQECSLGGEGALVATGTGPPLTPGCGNFASTLAIPIQVDNQNPLAVQVTTGTTFATTFSAVKLYYRLQVSPAPATATFSDVPTTHPFFKFVEALYASGITAGCGGGKFCPDSPLTRGQMAVFLAAALGLHWPN